jgi:carbonic anhydrase/acetyltransferase-like protein (isoleucine patch superfamily)
MELGTLVAFSSECDCQSRVVSQQNELGMMFGWNALVMADGADGAVIGSGAVVTKPIEAYVIAVGNPAKVIRYRNEAEWTSPHLSDTRLSMNG